MAVEERVDVCTHDLAEREAACADGMCPLCMVTKRVALAELLAERKKRQAAEKRVKELEAVLRIKREEWVFRRSPAHRAN